LQTIQIYSIVIVEDELVNITILQQLLSSYQNIRIVGTAKTVEKAQKLIIETKPDLLFLDIELGDKNGLTFYQQLKEAIDWSMHVVVFSSHTEYAMDACCLSVFYFLSKPNVMSDFESLMKSFFKAKRIEEEQRNQGKTHNHEDSVIMIATNSGMISVHLNTIGYFYYLKKRRVWCMKMSSQKEFTLKHHTKAEHIMAISPSFRKINPSIIINIQFFAEIIDNQCILSTPFESDPAIIFSRFALKTFQDRFNQI
jgi:two-component system LytT family response regulator